MSRFATVLTALVVAACAAAVLRPEVYLGFLEVAATPRAVEIARVCAGNVLLGLAAVLVVAALIGPPRTRPVAAPLATPAPAPAPAAQAAEVLPFPAPATLSDTPEPVAEESAAPFAASPDAEAETVAPKPDEPARPPEPATAPQPRASLSFAELRQRLREEARAESWDAAGRTLQAVRRAADTPDERRLAAQDLGDFLRGQGRAEEAAEAYADALQHARATGDGGAVADALTNIGDMAGETRRPDVALSSYEEALGLRRAAMQAAPDDLTAAHAVTLALERLADAREDRGHGMRALSLYRESEALGERLAEADPARYGAELAATRARRAALEERLDPEA